MNYVLLQIKSIGFKVVRWGVGGPSQNRIFFQMCTPLLSGLDALYLFFDYCFFVTPIHPVVYNTSAEKGCGREGGGEGGRVVGLFASHVLPELLLTGVDDFFRMFYMEVWVLFGNLLK